MVKVIESVLKRRNLEAGSMSSLANLNVPDPAHGKT